VFAIVKKRCKLESIADSPQGTQQTEDREDAFHAHTQLRLIHIENIHRKRTYQAECWLTGNRRSKEEYWLVNKI